MLMKGKGGSDVKVKEDGDEVNDTKDDGEGLKTRSRRKGKNGAGRKRYTHIDGDDDEYFKRLENGELEAEKERERLHTKTNEELGREWQYKAQRKFSVVNFCSLKESDTAHV